MRFHTKIIFGFLFIASTAVLASPTTKIEIQEDRWNHSIFGWHPMISLRLENLSANSKKLWVKVYIIDPDGIEKASDTNLLTLRPNSKKDITLDITRFFKKEYPAGKNKQKWSYEIHTALHGSKHFSKSYEGTIQN